MGILLVQLLDFLLGGAFAIHVGGAEVASGEKGNAQCGEVIRRNVVLLHQHLPVSRISISVNFDISVGTAFQGEFTGNGRNVNPRHAVNSFEEAVEKLPARCQIIVLALRQQCREGHNVAALKASRRISEVVETAQQQSSGRQQRKRYRNLAYYKPVTEPAVPARWTQHRLRRGFQFFTQVKIGCLQGRSQAKKNAHKNAHQNSEQQNRDIYLDWIGSRDWKCLGVLNEADEPPCRP